MEDVKTSKRVYDRERHKRIQETKAGRVRPDKCELCGNNTCNRALHYDHDHGTNIFRGWLCQWCNVALGAAGDNPVLLRRLADYLEKHKYTITRSIVR